MQARFNFMKAHGRQFDDHLLKELRNEACGLSKDAGKFNPKVQNGPGAPKMQLSDSTKKLLDEKWKSIVFPCTGYETYESLHAGVNQKLGRVFPV